ncbi:MAG TPA: cation:proton antiporter [Candidatus Nanopelagicales bacterium]|nr:cation:proton antiporter [Candidatus Nanopelagicales bacterium]
MIAPVTFVALAVLAYALVSKRLASTIVTAPIFFAAVGFVAGPVLGFVDLGARDQVLMLLLEAALVMVLFADSTGLDVRRWTKEPVLSGRLLGIGLPLTIAAGAVIAAAVFAGVEPWQAALVGVMLAPTDAALGQAVVANPRVPAVIRNALNVESGLNDGLVLPFVTILITVGLVAGGAETETRAAEVLLLALGGSTAIGLLAGLGGGWLVRAAAERDLAAGRWQAIALVALAVGTFVLAEQVEASGFLAVWVAGLCAGAMVRGHVTDDAFHLTEEAADALTAVGFLLLGAGLLGPVIARATPEAVLYAVLSLTVVRILPVGIAMLRTGLATPTLLYVGWFGPRGLASIVFAGVVVEQAVPAASAMTDVVLLTVALSLVVHGVTAAWGARRYAAWFERAAAVDPAIPEAAEVREDGVYSRESPQRGVHAA